MVGNTYGDMDGFKVFGRSRYFMLASFGSEFHVQHVAGWWRSWEVVVCALKHNEKSLKGTVEQQSTNQQRQLEKMIAGR